MTTIISTLMASMAPLQAVIGTVFIIFVAFSVLAVQFWTDLPRLQCPSPTVICTGSMILDPAELGCVCTALNITDGGPGHFQLRNGEWSRVKTIPASLDMTGDFITQLEGCEGVPKMEELFYCDGLGAIKFDNIFWTMVVVFQTITLEGWTEIMYLVDNSTEGSFGWLYFVSVAFFAGLFVIQLLLAVITKSYSDVAADERAQASGDMNQWLANAVGFWMDHSPLELEVPPDTLITKHFQLMLDKEPSNDSESPWSPYQTSTPNSAAGADSGDGDASGVALTLRRLTLAEIVAGVDLLWEEIIGASPLPAAVSSSKYVGVYASSINVSARRGSEQDCRRGPNQLALEAAFDAKKPIKNVETFRLLLEHAVMYNKLLAIFEDFDANDDGEIDMQEFVMIVVR